jgi:MoxR-like ATPase
MSDVNNNNEAVPENKDAIHANIERLGELTAKAKQEFEKIIVGQDELTTLMLAGMLSHGHLLLEGVPGIAKTLSAKIFSKIISCSFSRIQFTPDLMPSDVTGTSVFNMKTSEFMFNRGPIFSNIVLIDEINRAPAKTQAALFEVMEERQVTIDGKTYKMDFPFLVVATQNPIEQEGTYRMPEAQLDRFLFKIKLDYPTLEQEAMILDRFNDKQSDVLLREVQPVFSTEDLAACMNTIEQIYVKKELVKYIAQIVHSTRNHGDLFLGASPRASLAILRASKAIAAMNGRDFVTPDDIRDVTFPVLNHRISLTAEREMEGETTENVITGILKKIEVPK